MRGPEIAFVGERLHVLTQAAEDLFISVSSVVVQQAKTNQALAQIAHLLKIGGTRPDFGGTPARYNGRGEVRPWLHALNLYFDAAQFDSDARLTYTRHLLSQSALAVYEHARPSKYSALCILLIQLGDGLDTYANNL